MSLAARWQALQPRERMLLVIMMIVLPSLVLFIITVTISQQFEAMAAEVEQYREALYYLEDHQRSYLDDKKSAEAMRERLVANDLKVANFLSQTATTLGFDVSVTPKDPRKLEAGGEEAEEQEFEISVTSAPRDALLEYLWQIDQSEAPIFLRRIDMRRSSSAKTATDTMLGGSITVISYRLKDAE